MSAFTQLFLPDPQQLLSHLERYSSERGEELQCRWISNAVDFLESYQRQYDIIFMDSHPVRSTSHDMVWSRVGYIWLTDEGWTCYGTGTGW